MLVKFICLVYIVYVPFIRWVPNQQHQRQTRHTWVVLKKFEEWQSSQKLQKLSEHTSSVLPVAFKRLLKCHQAYSFLRYDSSQTFSSLVSPKKLLFFEIQILLDLNKKYNSEQCLPLTLPFGPDHHVVTEDRPHSQGVKKPLTQIVPFTHIDFIKD